MQLVNHSNEDVVSARTSANRLKPLPNRPIIGKGLKEGDVVNFCEDVSDDEDNCGRNDWMNFFKATSMPERQSDATISSLGNTRILSSSCSSSSTSSAVNFGVVADGPGDSVRSAVGIKSFPIPHSPAHVTTRLEQIRARKRQREALTPSVKAVKSSNLQSEPGSYPRTSVSFGDSTTSKKHIRHSQVNYN